MQFHGNSNVVRCGCFGVYRKEVESGPSISFYPGNSSEPRGVYTTTVVPIGMCAAP